VVGLDIDGDGQEDSQVYADVQDDLAPSYHSPFSIAVGGSYTRGATSIHASAEWFDGVDRYQILDAANLPAEFPGASIAQRVTQELDPVINWGIGIQHVFSRAWTGYLSFLTDCSAAPEDSPAMNSVSTWDLYHISTGGAFRVKGLDLTAGFQYARGKEDIQVGFVPGQGWDNEIPIGLQKNTDVTYQRLLFIIGFAFSI